MKEFLIAYFRVPILIIVWMMETFAANRARVAALMARPGVARGFRIAVVATFFIWLAVAFFFGSEEAGDRFEEAVRGYFPQAEEWGLFDAEPEDAGTQEGRTEP